MICEPSGPCGDEPARLGVVDPVPGATALHRRLGYYHDFVGDLVARIEQRRLDGEIIGRRWDVEGDPQAMDLVDMWAFVAEGVAAYAELTAGEAYLQTARDWLDLARLADHVGYRPSQRVAAEGWVRFDTDRTSSPLVPAGTRVQASGLPTREPQTYEVVTDTQLVADWAGVTATWVPEPAPPDARAVRFLGDPGFRAGDQVLLIEESAPPLGTGFGWLAFLLWILGFIDQPSTPTVTPLAIVNVVGQESELGTTLVEFDRDVSDLLADALTTTYAAYRILDHASTARRIASVLRIDSGGAASNVNLSYDDDVFGARFAVLDRELVDLSTDRLVAVVEWGTDGARGDVVPIAQHVPVEWEVVPGTSVLVSKVMFGDDVATLDSFGSQRSVYVLDRRVVATHHVFPSEQPAAAPGAGLQLRVWPAPATSHPPSGKLAVETTGASGPTWELLDVVGSVSVEEATPGTDMPPGLILDVVDHSPAGALEFARASGNVVRVRHGTTTRSVLPGGDGVTHDHEVQLPEAPVAAVLDATGAPVSSVDVHINGRRWTERPTLFGAGQIDAFEARLGADGEVSLQFGDGLDGAIPPSGTTNLVAAYRVGGGTEGEVGAGEIDTLLGSIRGVRSVEGAGSTSGGADQPRESQLRREAPTRAQAMDRVVSLGDLSHLALAFPGVSHATSWLGEGPDAACATGLHVAILRYGTQGVREATGDELGTLSAHLDSRRDVSLPLCVVSARVVAVSLDLTVVVDETLVASAVVSDIIVAITDPDGALAATNRWLGQPLDRSDVASVVHGVTGVLGVQSMTLATATASASASVIGRLAADRYELLVVGAPNVQVLSP